MPELVAERMAKLNAIRAARPVCPSNRTKHRCEGILHPLRPGECSSGQARFYLWEVYLEPPYLRGHRSVDRENVVWEKAITDWHLAPQNFMQWHAWVFQSKESTAWERVKCQRPLPYRCSELKKKLKKPKAAFVWILKWRVPERKSGVARDRYLTSLKGQTRSGVTHWLPQRHGAKRLRHRLAANTWLERALTIMRRHDGVYTSGRFESTEAPRLVRFRPGRVKEKASFLVNEPVNPIDQPLDHESLDPERDSGRAHEQGDGWERWKEKEKSDAPLDERCCQTWVTQRQGRVMVRCGYARPCPVHDLEAIEAGDASDEAEPVQLALQDFRVMSVNAEQYALAERDPDHELQELEIDRFETTSWLEAARIVRRRIKEGIYPEDARPLSLSYEVVEIAQKTTKVSAVMDANNINQKYVRHMRLGRIGRVVHENEYGDVRVTDVPTRSSHRRAFYPDQAQWLSENIEPCTYETWLARANQRQRELSKRTRPQVFSVRELLRCETGESS